MPRIEQRLALGEWRFRGQFWREPWYAGVRLDLGAKRLVVIIRPGMMDEFMSRVSGLEWKGCPLSPREMECLPPADAPATLLPSAVPVA